MLKSFFFFFLSHQDKIEKKMAPLKAPPPPIKTGEDYIFENPAVSHQLGVDRDDMVAPGNKKKFVPPFFFT